MEFRMKQATALVIALGLPFTLFAQGKAKPKSRPKPPSASQVALLQSQVKHLTAERDQLKEKLAASEGLETEIAAVQRSRDAFKAEAEGLKREFDRLKASMNENQSGSDAILQDLRQAREEAKAAQDENAKLKQALSEAQAKLLAPTSEGTLVTLGPNVTPAKPINLLRVTPSRKKVERGVVVLNLLISEAGEVLEARLLQGYAKEGEWEQKAHEACLEAAKKLVFDPARDMHGTKVRVWQGVGFFLD
jgi:seryl-tRNA synthetase